ncbi:hypothetical protein [Embleya sp. NPDC050493]|uniref:hypothetical protein n=1 Tax=Embleya sp. NPDC050493 TaxID=3363989 RepID=UPI0037933A0B
MEDERVSAWFARVATTPGLGIPGRLHAPAVRVVRVGLLFDVAVIDRATGHQACSLLRAAGDLGPVVESHLGRCSFLVEPGHGAGWNELVAQAEPGAVAARFVSTGAYLWIPTACPPRPGEQPAAWWVQAPRTVGAGVALTDPARLCAALGLAAHFPTAAG